MATPPIAVGIDVSEATLDVAVRPGDAAVRATNDPAGLAARAERLRPLAPALVVPEATGGSEAPLQVAGIPAVAVNPRRTRDVAEATGRLAKTDRIAAAALAHFAAAVRPEPRPAASAAQRPLDALRSRRGQPVEMPAMEANRLSACTDAAARAGIERYLARLGAKSADAEWLLAEAVRAGPARRERDGLLRSIPGIGPAVSRTSPAALPEPGTADGGRLSAPVGPAPHAHDSGALRGGRPIRGGRADVRRAADLAARSAAWRDGPLRGFADRLRSRGETAKVVPVAVAREPGVIANAVVRSGRPWPPELAMPRGGRCSVRSFTTSALDSQHRRSPRPARPGRIAGSNGAGRGLDRPDARRRPGPRRPARRPDASGPG